MGLWKFLRTIRQNPGLANLVCALHVGNWGFYLPPQYGHIFEMQLSGDDDLEIIRTAIREAGIDHLQDSIANSLAQGDRRPLMALLLTSLPNLEVMYAHIPRSDPVLAAVLEKILDRQDHGHTAATLQNLR